ncbi:cytochrome c biogenesis protein CcdA [Gilvimarinus algae]|uniref:Cytochrome c biogenesis protein CcdA n=1 Tax=Gilvimarinus algae TaxID=3058037 RepID=A0ABT8TCB1_9GAMM|nr:cytochrome c biogenesis protein CcdA [Gilvimarinus sp. SDUM040014]MDO3381561.1 cytochrome c biogenesis protein CcdA [Gilvimarinus sp. SDUM040014]
MELDIQLALSAGEISAGLFLLVFVTGLMTSLTPCVYPLLPVSAAMVGRVARGRAHAFSLSSLYALGLALVYALLGVLAAVSGQLFGAVASHPFTLACAAALCFAMAAWMQGWLRLPARFANPGPTGTFTGPISLFIAGGLSGLVMAPCTSPVLGMLLMYVAARGELVAGGSLMFVFAFGMCALLIIAGTFTGLLARLPRSGSWMLFLKSAMALLMALAGCYLAFLAWQNL